MDINTAKMLAATEALREYLYKRSRDASQSQRPPLTVTESNPSGKKNPWIEEALSRSEDREAFYSKVIGAIKRERIYQEVRHGTIQQRPHEVGAWLTIMRNELREAEEAWMKDHSDWNALREILEVMAVGFACMEQHGVIQRPGASPAAHAPQTSSGGTKTDTWAK